MAEKKTGAAKHSADYRDREKKEAERLGIEKMTLVTAAGTKQGMAEAMQVHGFSQLQELLQDLHLSFLACDREEQARRLKRPDAPAFEISLKLAHQFEAASMAELKRDPGCEIINPSS
ncbi:hypothetical protein [Pseudomonas donghuensis]|uniref:hypothetical protein n=1 Tax=Pseudomonas donghuensis TaxID=1163398 RepID=UPI002160CE43|nr:hypothetical protein [Pseudomonas donghuensis]UVL26204.1 hypothetical protein LOY30_09555 [Pseudomonas donghuensis]